jgi:GTP-binding protein
MKSIYITSSPSVTQCPQTTEPEYAFIGRSNVGKSSLINMLTQHKGLAKTSSMPGKTMLINYFQVDDSWYLVDLPGYGYAKRSKKEQDKLVEMIHNYVIGRQQLLCLFVLIDSRLTPQQIDLDFIHFLGENGVPFSLVFTKSDKQSRAKTFANVTTFLKTLEEEWEELPPHFVTSAETREGREELLEYIYSINDEA